MKNRLRIMSHNVWNCDENKPAWEEKGEDCSAAARVASLVRVYKETMPDIIGGQEVSALMAELLSEGCRAAGVEYTLVWGRYTPILYRADKLELLDSAFGTYPEEMEGLEGRFNDHKSKSWNLGVFRQKPNGKIFIFVTTHLWWKTEKESRKGEKNYQAHSDKARENQVEQVLEKIKKYQEKYDCPAVLVGDLNTDYHSKAVSFLKQNGMHHAHDIATEYAEQSVGYHYCFADGYKSFYDDRPFETAIDHILLLGEREGCVKRFERYSPDYYFPISDHSPAFIDVEF